MADTMEPAAAAAETLEETVDAVLEAVNETVNGTGKPPSTPEGMAVAYGSLVVMALIPIFLGAFRSVKHQDEQKAAGEPVESMTSKDAAMFPLIASCALFGLYVFFKIFSKEHINLLLTVYFFFLGVFALAHILSPIFSKLCPVGFPNANYKLLFYKNPKSASSTTTTTTIAATAPPGESEGAAAGAATEEEPEEELLNYEFDRRDLVCLLICMGIGVWYFLKKHWIANNLFGLAFAVNGVELLQLPKISTGCILLGGLFFYDIFWVFGTDVMVTVAKSFEAPIKLVFPQDLLENGPLAANNFAMLGLGDIVIPGIFIALLLRFDLRNLKKTTPAGSSSAVAGSSSAAAENPAKIYFYTGFVAYISGLLLTIFIMHVYKHAQPALLYLVPACVGAPIIVATLRGELKTLFSYDDAAPADGAAGVVEAGDADGEAKKEQ